MQQRPLSVNLALGNATWLSMWDNSHDLVSQAAQTEHSPGVGGELRCSRLLVVDDDREAIENVEDRRVAFIPLWKWLLGGRDPH
jgi:hypothetical protein